MSTNEKLMARDLEMLKKSPYPTRDCLHPNQIEHIQECPHCTMMCKMITAKPPAPAGGASDFYKQKYGYAPQRGETFSVEAAMQFADDYNAQLRQERDALGTLLAKIANQVNEMAAVDGTSPVSDLNDIPLAIRSLQASYTDAARARNGEAGQLLKRQEAKHKKELSEEREARERAEIVLRLVAPFLRRALKREIEHPANHQEFARELQEMLNEFESALAALKSSQEEGKS